MNACRSIPIILIMSLCLSVQARAQELSYTTNRGITIGFGPGGSYQTSDIKNSFGGGFDFFLGSYLYKKQGAVFALDWKFRFLAGSNYAHDHRINTDDTYSNINFRHFNYDLELGLTLNRLREKTRIVFSAFAGGGISHGLTSTDLLDADNNPYDYSVINPGLSRSQVNDALLELSDRVYETKLVNKAALLPTAGLYLGYQLSPSFRLGIVHKINFSLGEDNGTFSIDIDNKIVEGSAIDMNHFTGISFNWTFRGKSSQTYTPDRPSPVYPDPVPVTPPVTAPATGLPVVNITVPYNSVHYTQNRDVNIIARVRRVNNKQDISVNYDGNDIDFEFSPENARVQASVFMEKDSSIFTVSCRNKNGLANDTLVLIFKERTNISNRQGARVPIRVTNPVRVNNNTNIAQVNTKNEVIREDEQVNVVKPVKAERPVISFINPASPLTVDNNIFPLKVQTSGVASWSDVDMVINGAANSNFSFTQSGVVNLVIGLREGVNTIEVSGKNAAGRVTEKTTITYKKPVEITAVVTEDAPCPAPEINAGVDEINSGGITHKLRGTVTNVSIRANISVTVNGTGNQSFGFHPASGLVTADFNLTPGLYTIILTARNDCGEVNKSFTVNIEKVEEEEVVEEEDIDEQEEQAQAPVAEGIRINPGNSSWQFCLITPGGQYNSENLTDPKFRYSGQASSLYFLPIGGGGNAIVNGKTFALRSGIFYLFEGNLKVSVSTQHKNSMGHWSVKIEADRAPISGNGNNRPKSPCETTRPRNNKN